MFKIIFLGQKTIAKKCFSVISQSKYKNKFLIKAIVSDLNFYNSVTGKNNVDKPYYISNTNRNEKKILDISKLFNINLLISVQHTWILSRSILSAVKYNAFNLHNAKIPNYKGYNTITHAILNGEKTYSTTIHWMVDCVDVGDIAYEKTFKIDKNDTAFSLYQKSVKESVINFKKFINDLNRNFKISRKSVIGSGTFYKKNEIESLRLIRSIQDYEEVDTKSRAFYFPPYEQAYLLLKGKKFYVSQKLY